MTLTADSVQPNRAESSDAWLESAFQEHWARVFAVLYRLVGDSSEAEDLALETFWRLHSRRPPLREEHSLSGWLYRVATNLGLNALRARQRRSRYEIHAGRESLEDSSSANPADEVERLQESQLVRDALGRIKPRSAQILVLRHSGLSYAEIAPVLGVDLSSVGTLLARAEREFEGEYHKIGGSHASH